MSRQVIRKGIIISVQKRSVTVAVNDDNNCAACGIKSMCSHESDRSTIVIPVATPSAYAAGDKVEITVSSHLQGYAVLIGIMLPCGFMTSVAATILAAGGSETLAACSALITVAAYYGILYRAKGASARFFRWDIKKLDNNTPI